MWSCLAPLSGSREGERRGVKEQNRERGEWGGRREREGYRRMKRDQREARERPERERERERKTLVRGRKKIRLCFAVSPLNCPVIDP